MHTKSKITETYFKAGHIFSQCGSTATESAADHEQQTQQRHSKSDVGRTQMPNVVNASSGGGGDFRSTAIRKHQHECGQRQCNPQQENANGK